MILAWAEVGDPEDNRHVDELVPGQPGGTVSRDALHRAALAAIADTFGDILKTEQLLALPLRR
jgi:hypothetical protein